MDDGGSLCACATLKEAGFDVPNISKICEWLARGILWLFHFQIPYSRANIQSPACSGPQEDWPWVRTHPKKEFPFEDKY